MGMKCDIAKKKRAAHLMEFFSSGETEKVNLQWRVPELDVSDFLLLLLMLHDDILHIQNNTLKQDIANPVPLSAAALI